jgi:cyclase
MIQSNNRIIPCLLLKGRGFYKTLQFRNPVYLGEPVNILKIFNEKGVNEIVILDIDAALDKREPNFALLQDLASECFMPLAYGGGLTHIDQIKRLFRIGFEKAVINTSAIEDPSLIEEASRIFGAQSVVVCIDVKKKIFGGDEVVIRGGRQKTGMTPENWARRVEALGAGEIIINSVDRDGTMSGYDLDLINRVALTVSVPVVALGGARNVADFALAVKSAHASACAAGAMFVFQGRHRAVLINVPTANEIEAALA